MVRNLVIVPTYKEKENISRIVGSILTQGADYSVLVVDDSSPDGTAEIVKQMMPGQEDRIFLLERQGKLGLGTAYITGFKWGVEKGYDYIFEMDADFSHDPNDLNRLLRACRYEGADVSVGSRYVKGGKLKNWPATRIMLSYGASLYVRIFTGLRVKDPTSGFKCYSRKVLETIDLDRIKFIGYAFQIEMKFAAQKLGFRIVEIPITFTDRIAGESKISKNIIWEGVFGVLKMKWRSFFYSYSR